MATLLSSHPYLVSASIAIGTWVFNNIVTVMITSLPSPTKDSTGRYVYWFKVLNTVIGNLKRAQSSNVENSPNWADALVKAQSTPPAGP